MSDPISPPHSIRRVRRKIMSTTASSTKKSTSASINTSLVVDDASNHPSQVPPSNVEEQSDPSFVVSPCDQKISSTKVNKEKDPIQNTFTSYTIKPMEPGKRKIIRLVRRPRAVVDEPPHLVEATRQDELLNVDGSMSDTESSGRKLSRIRSDSSDNTFLSSRVSVQTVEIKRGCRRQPQHVGLMDVKRRRLVVRSKYDEYTKEYEELKTTLADDQLADLEYHLLLIQPIDASDAEQRNIKKFRRRGYKCSSHHRVTDGEKLRYLSQL